MPTSDSMISTMKYQHLCIRNLIRVLREVEGVRDKQAVERLGADNTWVPRGDLGADTGCMSEVELA